MKNGLIYKIIFEIFEGYMLMFKYLGINFVLDLEGNFVWVIING